MKKILLIIFWVFLFLTASQVLAAHPTGIVPCGGQNQPACQFCHIFVLLNNIFVFLLIPNADINNNFPLIPTIAGLMLIIGGLYLLTAGINPQSLNRAKSVITAAIIGLVIIFIAWVFLNTLLAYMDIKTWTGFIDNPSTPQVEGWWDFTNKCPIR